MSKITTLSTFYYGHRVNSLNKYIDFDEGGPELTAEIPVNDYTAEEYRSAIQDALNSVGALTYTVSLNRVTRKITIAGTGTFTLRTLTGTQAGSSAFTVIGLLIGSFLLVM